MKHRKVLDDMRKLVSEPSMKFFYIRLGVYFVPHIKRTSLRLKGKAGKSIRGK